MHSGDRRAGRGSVDPVIGEPLTDQFFYTTYKCKEILNKISALNI